MEILFIVLLVFVAVMHLGFLLLEMVYWTQPLGRKVFRTTPEQAEATRVMAINQGAYNGFLAVGLLWAAYKGFHGNWEWAVPLAIFFLGCVVVAGVVGAMTVNRRIFFVQACPALITLLLLVGQLVLIPAV